MIKRSEQELINITNNLIPTASCKKGCWLVSLWDSITRVRFKIQYQIVISTTGGLSIKTTKTKDGV